MLKKDNLYLCDCSKAIAPHFMGVLVFKILLIPRSLGYYSTEPWKIKVLYLSKSKCS